IIDVEEACAVAIMDPGIEVPGDRDIENHNRTTGPAVGNWLIALLGNNRLGRARGAEDDIRSGESIVELAPRDSSPATGVHQGPGRSMLFGFFVSLLDLAGDLSLADDQAIQTSHDAEQVADRVGLTVLVEMRAQLRNRHLVDLAQILSQEIGIRSDRRIR